MLILWLDGLKAFNANNDSSGFTFQLKKYNGKLPFLKIKENTWLNYKYTDKYKNE